MKRISCPVSSTSTLYPSPPCPDIEIAHNRRPTIMSSLSSQTFWFLQNNTDIGNATDISIPIATATLSWITISTAGFLAFSTLIGSDAFENYCASGPILWTAGSLYLSPVGSIGVFKSGIKMFWGPDRSKRLGWEPQDILLNKEKLYNFARHATPRYVVNKSESHYRRLYTWRKRKGQSQPTGSDSGSTTLASESRSTTQGSGGILAG